MQKKTKKFIDFIITQNCTYRCVYCSQSKLQNKNKKDASKETIENFLKFLDKIDTDFEITITGGEAILHPEFFNLISEIKNRGFKINLITNFSFEIEKYEKIFNILKENLNFFDISFHLDEINKQYRDFNDLIKKLDGLLKFKNERTILRFFFPLYNPDSFKKSQIQTLIEFAKQNKIEYSFQKIRFLDRYKTFEFEKEFLKEKRNKKTFSKICAAGKTSAVIYEDGSVYRCYSSRFLKTNYLGNINNKEFSLNSSYYPCASGCCLCDKPFNYGQIQEEKDFKKALCMRLLNNLFFSFYDI